MSSSQHDFCFILASLFIAPPSSPPPARARLSSSQLSLLAHMHRRREGGELQVARCPPQCFCFVFCFVFTLKVFTFSVSVLPGRGSRGRPQQHVPTFRVHRKTAPLVSKFTFIFVYWYQSHCIFHKVLQRLRHFLGQMTCPPQWGAESVSPPPPSKCIPAAPFSCPNCVTFRRNSDVMWTHFTLQHSFTLASLYQACQ